MSYTVFKNANNYSITAPNESGEIVLDTSISKQIRIEVDRNTYRFYDIAEKKYLRLLDIGGIDPERCFFTAIIYPCGETFNAALVDNEENYPILYKFVNSCLDSTFGYYPPSSFNGMYCSSNNIYFEKNKTKLEFEFHSFIDVKIRLNISPSGSNKDTTFDLTSDDVEIISLFQHNIFINASRNVSGTTNYTYIHSLSFSFINNRYEQYDRSGLINKTQLESIIEDLPQNKRYPASGLLYIGSYANGSNNMSISVYTIKYINRNTSGNLNVHGLLTGKESASTSISTIDYTNQSINPSTVATLSVIDDVIRLS